MKNAVAYYEIVSLGHVFSRTRRIEMACLKAIKRIKRWLLSVTLLCKTDYDDSVRNRFVVHHKDVQRVKAMRDKIKTTRALKTGYCPVVSELESPNSELCKFYHRKYAKKGPS